MTVEELVEELKKYPTETEVYLEYDSIAVDLNNIEFKKMPTSWNDNPEYVTGLILE